MNKGLEALKNIKKEAGTFYFSTLYDIDMWHEDFATIETELKRLEELEKEWEMEHTLRIRLENITHEQSEILQIIKDKKVDVALLKGSCCYEQYCSLYITRWKDVKNIPLPTQAEFDLLKEWLNEEEM